MNILIPDEWLRQYLKTDVTPKEFKDRVSLSGVSVERIYGEPGHEVYDIEVTTNRVDCMSVVGIAREAGAILDSDARYRAPEIAPLPVPGKPLTEGLTIRNDPTLCRRITAVRLDNVTIGPSPAWLADRLTAAGQRPINNVVDVTNYVMLELGHPLHAFDYDRLTEKTIIVREAKKGETFVTLDGKSHTTGGGEVVFDDGTGTIVDLPGIMGTDNSVVTETTKTVLLWSEDVNPVKIRQASMGLAIRTNAAVINEKQPDDELAPLAVARGAQLIAETAGAAVSSDLYDDAVTRQQPAPIVLPKPLLEKYLGMVLMDGEVKRMLVALGFTVGVSEHAFDVTPPTWRIHDVVIAEDVIEEVARIKGYHNLPTKLPDTEIPRDTHEDPVLRFEADAKRLLAGWGYTETYPYSMVSKAELLKFGYADEDAYVIENPLSEDWVALRPDLIPTMVRTVLSNHREGDALRLFELSMAYRMRRGDLPDEHQMLVIAATGGIGAFGDLKGTLQALFDRLGIPWRETVTGDSGIVRQDWAASAAALIVPGLGFLGRIRPELVDGNTGVYAAELDLRAMAAAAAPNRAYHPLPKYPAATEDLSLVVPEKTHIGPILEAIQSADPLITDVTLLDTYKDSRTVRITFRTDDRTVTSDDIQPVRRKLIGLLREQYGIRLKGEE
jgi:phenylalanyl-tRNA synthetase beta chain